MGGFVKLMAGEDLVDSDPMKCFEIISLGDGQSVFFNKDDEGRDQCVISVLDGDQLVRTMFGNVYVLSESGKSVASRMTNVVTPDDAVLLSNKALAANLALLDLGDAIDVLVKAALLNVAVKATFATAMGEALYTLADVQHPKAKEAARHAASFPANDKNLGIPVSEGFFAMNLNQGAVLDKVCTALVREFKAGNPLVEKAIRELALLVK